MTGPSSAGASAALLERHRPLLRYDSGERLLAVSPALLLAAPGARVLREHGTPLGGPASASGPGPRTERTGAPGGLGLGDLGRERYHDGVIAGRGDRVSAGSGESWAWALAHQHDPAYAHRVVGHVCRGSDGRLWLAYWMFFLLNDYTLLGPWLPAGRHEGDWEMIQLRVGPDGTTPDLALYAHHQQVSARPWSTLERARDGDEDGNAVAPVVYLARGGHGAYFTAGRHFTGTWIDRADGRGMGARAELIHVVDGDPGSDWALWPGRWGITRPGRGIGARLGIDARSPHGPGHQRQWHDPAKLLAEARSQ